MLHNPVFWLILCAAALIPTVGAFVLWSDHHAIRRIRDLHRANAVRQTNPSQIAPPVPVMADYPDYGAAFSRLRARIAYLEAALHVMRTDREHFGQRASDFAAETLFGRQLRHEPRP